MSSNLLRFRGVVFGGQSQTLSPKDEADTLIGLARKRIDPDFMRRRLRAASPAARRRAASVLRDCGYGEDLDAIEGGA